jgi:Arabinose efflux permease
VELDLKRVIDQRPMSRFQITAVAVCVVLNMLDGFDTLAVAFSAAHISAAWHLDGKDIGLLFSAGLLGMSVGSLFVAPLADRIGRRPLVLACLVAMTTGMLISAEAQNFVQLISARAWTGVGIGGMLASIAVIASEYSSDRWRSGAISMQSTGYSFGATVGGATSAYLLTHLGWRSVFMFGGVATAILIPVVYGTLPESLAFLLARRPSSALKKVNIILDRMGLDSVDALPKQASRFGESKAAQPLERVRSMTIRTLFIWASYFCVVGGFYFVMSWTPKLLVQAGMTAVQGVTGGVLLNLGGMVGCTLFSLVAARVQVGRLLKFFLIASAVLIGLFGAVSSSLGIALVVAVAMGGMISACVGGLYSITPSFYPTETRAAGMGWAIGVGRAGAITAPFLVGFLIDTGWSVPELYYIFCIPYLAAVFFVGKASKGAKSLRYVVSGDRPAAN